VSASTVSFSFLFEEILGFEVQISRSSLLWTEKNFTKIPGLGRMELGDGNSGTCKPVERETKNVF
jgi:hypothetical protein